MVQRDGGDAAERGEVFQVRLRVDRARTRVRVQTPSAVVRHEQPVREVRASLGDQAEPLAANRGALAALVHEPNRDAAARRGQKRAARRALFFRNRSRRRRSRRRRSLGRLLVPGRVRVLGLLGLGRLGRRASGNPKHPEPAFAFTRVRSRDLAVPAQVAQNLGAVHVERDARDAGQGHARAHRAELPPEHFKQPLSLHP